MADGSWVFPDGEQTVFVDNDLANDDGEDFKNQGDCVSYFNHSE